MGVIRIAIILIFYLHIRRTDESRTFYNSSQLFFIVFFYLLTAFTDVRHLPVMERGKLVAIEMVRYGKEYAHNEQFFPLSK